MEPVITPTIRRRLMQMGSKPAILIPAEAPAPSKQSRPRPSVENPFSFYDIRERLPAECMRWLGTIAILESDARIPSDNNVGAIAGCQLSQMRAYLSALGQLQLVQPSYRQVLSIHNQQFYPDATQVVVRSYELNRAEVLHTHYLTDLGRDVLAELQPLPRMPKP